MREIEVAAGRLFAEIGMSDVAGHPPPPAGILLGYIQEGRAWAATEGEAVVGYALAEVVDEAGHLEQVSVHPEFGRRGIGRALVEAVAQWAREEGFSGLTLLTFRDVPWNGPYYASLGFQPLHDDDLTSELRARRLHEQELGLDIAARQAMRLELRAEVNA